MSVFISAIRGVILKAKNRPYVKVMMQTAKIDIEARKRAYANKEEKR